MNLLTLDNYLKKQKNCLLIFTIGFCRSILHFTWPDLLRETCKIIANINVLTNTFAECLETILAAFSLQVWKFKSTHIL